jgi:hypothetical protein
MRVPRVSVGRHEQHFDIGPHPQNALRELTASELRHDDVAEEQIDLPRVRRTGQSFAPIMSFEDDILTALQDSARELPDLVLILPRRITSPCPFGSRAGLRKWLLLVRQHRDGRPDELEVRTVPEFGREPNRTTALLYDDENHGQSKACSLAGVLCGENGLMTPAIALRHE